MLKEMNRLRTETVSKEELDGYKNYMSGIFALGLEDPRTLARYAINEKKYNMPKDYYKNYLKNLDNVTAADVKMVANKYITPGIAHITVSGDKKQVAEKLKQFGPVTVYDLYGNVESDKPVAAVPSNVSAVDVVKMHIGATGGEEAWKKVNDMTMVMTTEMQGMNITLKTIRKAPNKMFMDVNAMGQSFQKIVFDGKKGYTSAMGQKQDFGDAEVKEYADEASMSRDLNYLKPDYKLALKGIEKVDGNDAYEIEITKPDGDVLTEYYDVKSKLKVKSVASSEGPQGKMTQTTYYLDYKPGAGGLSYPNQIKQSAGPQTMDMKLQSVEVNTGIKDDVFQ
jgi:outer membrane lipoprotein-sorting protein